MSSQSARLTSMRCLSLKTSTVAPFFCQELTGLHQVKGGGRCEQSDRRAYQNMLSQLGHLALQPTLSRSPIGLQQVWRDARKEQ